MASSDNYARGCLPIEPLGSAALISPHVPIFDNRRSGFCGASLGASRPEHAIGGMLRCAGPSASFPGCARLIPSVACCFVTSALLSAGGLLVIRGGNRRSISGRTRRSSTMSEAQVAGGRGIIIPAPSGKADSTVIFMHGLGKKTSLMYPRSRRSLSLPPHPANF
jgi:hypothetical protein